MLLTDPTFITAPMAVEPDASGPNPVSVVRCSAAAGHLPVGAFRPEADGLRRAAAGAAAAGFPATDAVAEALPSAAGAAAAGGRVDSGSST
jgi:hypothetical protein